MKVQLCLAVLVNVAIHHGFATPTCTPANGPEDAEYHPHPTDCSKFLTCVWSALVEQQCPSGTYWNDAVKACDFQENVNCELTPTSSTPSSSSTAAAVFAAEKCPDDFDPNHDVFLPHADCSKFYICTQLGAVEKSCPPGLHWNQNANVCDWPQVAGCTAGTGNPATTTTELSTATTVPTETTTVASTTSPVPPVGKCPEVYDSNDEVFLPHEDCTKYYLCTWNGRPVEQSCPPGLDWNANANQCDWPAQAGCRTTYVASPQPPQYVYWQRNDRMINYDDSRRDISIETVPGPRTQSRLIIREPQINDSGNYTCSASNTEPASIYVFVSKGDNTAAISRRKTSGAGATIAVTTHLSSLLLDCLYVVPGVIASFLLTARYQA